MKTIKVAIIGAAGYTGGEIIRLLSMHPNIDTIVPVSSSSAGQPVTSVHNDLFGDLTLDFAAKHVGDEDVIFLCMPHGKSEDWMDQHKPSTETLVIDLGQDFRLKRNCFVYGLSELNADSIAGSKRIANPGCFATLIQLMLIPFVQKQLLPFSIEIAATTGSTGAGQNPTDQTHFSRRAGNHSSYKTLQHQHLAEITETLRGIQKTWQGEINFVPLRGSFTRGIHAVVHFPLENSSEVIQSLLHDTWQNHAFVHVVEDAPSVKQVVNTNKCFVNAEKVNGRVVLTGVIDNLLKGASGQAVQNMNLALGFPETTGLKLKPLAY